MKTIFRIYLFLGVFTCLFSTPGVAYQNQTTISGTVVDNENKPIPYANIFLKGRMEGTISDESGKFSFTTSAIGNVALACSFIGYEFYEEKINLQQNQNIKLNIKLKQTEIKGEAVTVTASSFTAADEEGVTLTALDVVRTPGAAADIFWAIKSLPGLQQVEEGAGLFVRGGDVAETVFYLDGAIINHPYKYESPTGGFFGTFSPFLLKGTFFSSGGFSAQFGNALSGALSMESQDMPDRLRMGLGVGLAAESIYFSMPFIDNKFGFSLSGNRSNTRMLFEMNNNRKNFSQYPFSYDFNLNAIYRINTNNRLKFFIFRESDKVGLEVEDPDYSEHFHGNSGNQLYNVRYNGILPNKILLQANLAYSDFSRDMNLSVMKLNLNDRLYQFRLIGEKEILPSTILRSGIIFLKKQTLISGIVPQNEDDLNPNALTDKVDTDYNSDQSDQFIETETFIPFGIKMTAGLRGTYESITKKYSIDPRLSFIYSLTAHSNLMAAWGVYHQFPEQSYYDPYIGNPKLSAMKSIHYILGYAFQSDTKIFRLEGYYKDYANLLLEDVQSNYLNEGYGYATGIDAFAKDSFGPVSGWISYSWLKARRKWMDIPIVASPYFDITHNLSFVFNIDLPLGFSLGGGFRYATGRPYSSAQNKYHDSRVPSYQKADLNFSYMRSFFESNMTIFYFSISNVFDRINIFDYRYSQDYKRRVPVDSSFGRSVYFGISFNM